MHPEKKERTWRGLGLDNLNQAAKEMIEFAGEGRVWLLEGEMGAGKTTLIKALGKVLGVRDTIHSPTFGIVNEYESDNGRVFHFDFYRIKNESEAFEIGVEEYFYSGAYCFIEWPERIPSFIPDSCIRVQIHADDENTRTIGLYVHDGKEKIRV